MHKKKFSFLAISSVILCFSLFQVFKTTVLAPHERAAIEVEQYEVDRTEKVVIIGSGPAGITAAIYAAQAGLEPLVISGTVPGGQLTRTSVVTNWPGYEAISGKELMDSLLEHAKHAGASVIDDEVLEVNFLQKPFTVKTRMGKEIRAHSVIIATGATPKTLDITGEQKYFGRGISTCAICDGALYRNKEVVVIGDGNTAFENALYLKNFTDRIMLISKHNTLSGTHALREEILKDPVIQVVYNTQVTAFHGDELGITQLFMKNIKTAETIEKKCDGVFIAVGSRPNTTLFEDQLALSDAGYIKTHDQVKTSIDGVFVAGDVQETTKYRQAIVSAGFGCIAALEAEKYVATEANKK